MDGKFINLSCRLDQAVVYCNRFLRALFMLVRDYGKTVAWVYLQVAVENSLNFVSIILSITVFVC